MKLYLTELIAVTTPGENIIILDKLRSKYGEHYRDSGGAFYHIEAEDLLLLPQGTPVHAVYQGQEEQ